MTNTPDACTDCGYESDTEHGESLRTADDDSRLGEGERLCYECFSDHYEFFCCGCSTMRSNEEEHEVLAVTGSLPGLSGSVEPGVYRVIERPYYADGMIEGYVFNDAIERVADLPPRIDTGGEPAGQMCRECGDRFPQIADARGTASV